MSTPDADLQETTSTSSATSAGAYDEAGGGWILFAGIMLMLVGILNVIWGIAAIRDSSFFIHDTRYILSNLNTWGWVTVILGAVQILAAYSIWSGNQFGRWVGITVAGLSSIGALMSIPAYSGRWRSSRSTSWSSTGWPRMAASTGRSDPSLARAGARPREGTRAEASCRWAGKPTRSGQSRSFDRGRGLDVR